MKAIAPAEIMVPNHIKTVAIVDRSRARNAGQSVLGVIEGAISGEEIGADTQGRHMAIGAVRELLTESPRFDIVTPNLDRREIGSSLFARNLDWQTAQTICEAANCEGIISLEAFDSDIDNDVDVSETTIFENGEEKQIKEYEADQTLTVVTAWRFYDVENRLIVDEVRDYATERSWSSTGDTESEAVDNLPGQTASVEAVGDQSGIDYARRVAATYYWITRRLFKAGDSGLRTAARHARSGDWKRAAHIWTDLSRTGGSAKVRSRAMYNLAVDLERQGALDKAMEMARSAQKLHDKGRIRNYAETLRVRQAEEREAERQLEAARQDDE